jgi:uncharacterized protein (TIGR02145 family)
MHNSFLFITDESSFIENLFTIKPKKMKTQKRFSILNYLVVLFAFGLLFSCEQLAPVEEPIAVLEEFQDLSGLTIEPEDDPINGRLIYSSDCESDCIEPGSGNYFAIKNSKSQSSGINTKKVSYKAYNAEDRFVIKAKYEITTGPSQAKASITIQINGKKKEFKAVPSGYTATFSIPLDKGWDKCDQVTFSIVQKGLGSPISFSEEYNLIPVCEEEDTFTDPRDGQVYKIVRIGNQVWFAQNLNYLTESSSCLDDDPANCGKYGRLYKFSPAYEKDLCPEGWHVPKNEEWEILFDYLGGSDVAGGKMKSVTGWNEPNIGATNESGFNGLPNSYDQWTGELVGRWWTSSRYVIEDDEDFAVLIYWIQLNSELGSVRVLDTDSSVDPCACRCVKDSSN